MRTLLILIAVISVALVGCSNEEKIQEPTNVATKSKIYDLNLKEEEEFEIFKKAVSDSKQESGIVNMVNPQYRFKLEEESYFLWITQQSGTIMNTKDTHSIYTLSSSSVKEVYEFVNKAQNIE